MTGEATVLDLYRRKDLGKPLVHLIQRYHEPLVTPEMKRLEPSVHPTDDIEGVTPRLTPVPTRLRIADRPYLVEHMDLQRRIYAEHNKTFKRELLPDGKVSRITRVLVSISRRSVRSNS